jgi:hypothetical protein
MGRTCSVPAQIVVVAALASAGRNRHRYALGLVLLDVAGKRMLGQPSFLAL